MFPAMVSACFLQFFDAVNVLVRKDTFSCEKILRAELAKFGTYNF